MITNNRHKPIYYRLPADNDRARVALLSTELVKAFEAANAAAKGVLIHGPTGTGKTFAVLATARHAFWIDWPDFVSDVKAHYSIKSDDAHHFDPMRFATSYPGGMVVDDLGAERDPSGHDAELFDRLVAARARYGYLLSVTTNLTPEQIESRYGARCVSRLAGMCAFIELGGADRRMEAK